MWSEWSDCSNSLTRTRRRNCTDCDKREEQAPCVNSAKFKQEFPSISHQLESDLVAVPRKIANDFDSAQKSVSKSKAASKPAEEQSLFGEHDYESQGEVSYFGPPHKVDHRLEMAIAESMETQNNEAFPDITKMSRIGAQNDRQIKITAVKQPSKAPETYANDEEDAVIKDFENEHRKSAFFDKNSLRSSATFEEPEKKPMGEGVGVVEFHASGEHQRDLPVKPASVMRQSLGIPMAPKEDKKIVKKAECDPTIDCCPLVDMAARSARGCTVGYRLNKNKQQEGCVPEACRHKGAGVFRLL
uniref:ShKT domain-containing protein n=1 Tax=Panagrellus redivivus TaxID=6233 RepID=A0A7E4VHQ7_PANRE